MFELALFLHLVGAFLFVAGVAVAGVAHAKARRHERPYEIAPLLGVARTGVLLVAVGAVSVLVFGLWLVDVGGHRLTEPWLVAALVLFALAIALGAAGGRRPRRARLLATRLAQNNEPQRRSCAGSSTIALRRPRTTSRRSPSSPSSG